MKLSIIILLLVISSLVYASGPGNILTPKLEKKIYKELYFKGKNKMLKKYLAAGGDPNTIVTDGNGYRVPLLALAIRSGNRCNVENSRILIESGADVNFKWPEANYTLITEVANYLPGCIEVLRMLLENGALVCKDEGFAIRSMDYWCAWSEDKVKRERICQVLDLLIEYKKRNNERVNGCIIMTRPEPYYDIYVR